MPEENKDRQNSAWWKTWHTLSSLGLGLLAFSPELIDWATHSGLLKEYTVLSKMAIPLSVIVTIFGLKKQYMKDNLPSGLTKYMDRIPDKYTGEKGSLPTGLSNK